MYDTARRVALVKQRVRENTRRRQRRGIYGLSAMCMPVSYTHLETVLAEKLETVVSRATTNTRMRDFYDLHILSQLHGQSIVPAALRAALIATLSLIHI